MAKKPVAKPKTPEAHPEDLKHELLATRVMDAVAELNSALDAARESKGTMACVGTHGGAGEQKVTCQIYRLTHATMLFKVEVAQP